MILFEFFSGVGGMHQAISEIEGIKKRFVKITK